MKKIYGILIFSLVVCSFLGIINKAYAKDLDRITNYVVTVDPRMNDGTLDITYEITWKVLDSTSQGPLSWVMIGTPNDGFDNPTAITNNIKTIKKYNGSYVRIDFKKDYEAGEEVTFKYSIHQSYMHSIRNNRCIYTFTPAWFNDVRVDKLTIRWNADDVVENNSDSTSGNYLIWKKTDLAKGEKLTATIQYEKTSFTNLKTYTKQTTDVDSIGYFGIWFIIVITIIISFTGGGGGYYGHRGFYGGRGYYRSCVSSCACACARSCACACAGSGRAGCSKKDFYGTKLSMKKVEKVVNKKLKK